MEIIMCEHCFNYRKNPDTGKWKCILETIVVPGPNNTCQEWSCARCNQPVSIKGFDGGQPVIRQIDHNTCWGE